MALGICLGWSLRNLNYTKFNKERISIYQRHKKNTQIHEILQFFVLIKRIRKKKLIKDKVQIENADIRIIK